MIDSTNQLPWEEYVIMYIEYTYRQYHKKNDMNVPLALFYVLFLIEGVKKPLDALI